MTFRQRGSYISFNKNAQLNVYLEKLSSVWVFEASQDMFRFFSTECYKFTTSDIYYCISSTTMSHIACVHYFDKKVSAEMYSPGVLVR